MVKQMAVAVENFGDTTHHCLYILDSEGNIWRLDRAETVGYSWAPAPEWFKLPPPPLQFNAD